MIHDDQYVYLLNVLCFLKVWTRHFSFWIKIYQLPFAPNSNSNNALITCKFLS